MSASLKLTADQLTRLADALGRLSEIQIELGVDVAAYGSADVSVDGDATVKVRWDREMSQYVIDDLVGG